MLRTSVPLISVLGLIRMKNRASQFQKEVAGRLGIEIDVSSFSIAAAQIEEALAPALWLNPDCEPATAKQIEYAASLDIDVSNDPKRVASVKIQEQQDARNKALIKKMNLQPGTAVLWKRNQREMVISSIAENGRLWFKGGNGYGAFPHEIEPIEAQQGAADDAKTAMRLGLAEPGL